MEYGILNRFVIRSPLKPFTYIEQLLENRTFGLKEILARTDNTEMEAIYLASPNLYKKLMAMRQGKNVKEKDPDKLAVSLYKYLSRMSTRCTPFGLFAGCSLGKFSESSFASILRGQDICRKTRLDMDFLCALQQNICNKEEVRPFLKYYPNNSIYEVLGQYRYIEYRYKNAKREHFVVGTEKNEYLEKVLTKAQKGATISQLAASIIEEGISYEEAEGYLQELINGQFLVSGLDPNVSGEEYHKVLGRRLGEYPVTTGASQHLKKVEEILVSTEEEPTNNLVQSYEGIKEGLKNLNTEFNEKYIFQTDAYFKYEKSDLPESIRKDLLYGFQVLTKLSSKQENHQLSEFKDAFYKRYEEEEVPLYIALDPEIGIGFGNVTNKTSDSSPLVDDIILPREYTLPKMEWDNTQQLLFKKLQKQIKSGAYQVEITNEDIESLKLEGKELPATMLSMVEIFKQGETYQFLMQSVGGSSAANLLGRFTSGNKGIRELVEQICEEEKHYFKDKIIAEIVHLPESRTGNILMRSDLRDYEIPFLAKSLKKPNFQLPIDDITISVPHGRQIILRSKKHKKQIVPRLSTAHNYSGVDSLPIYQFLCALQTDGVSSGVGFMWGTFAQNIPFLPRVVHRNLILSQAQWNIEKKGMEGLYTIKSQDELQEKFEQWKGQKNLNDYVLLVSGDNELFLDLSTVIGIKTLLSEIKNSSHFVLKEFLTNSENALIRGENDFYTNQFVFVFTKKQENDQEENTHKGKQNT